MIRVMKNTFWASVNYAKFNRMLKKMLHFEIHARGTDLNQPPVGNTYDYICRKMKEGTIVLYLNNRILHKRNMKKIKFSVPTHFVVLESISKEDDMITMVYWDYGGKTLLQMQPEFLHKIVFGITQCVKKSMKRLLPYILLIAVFGTSCSSKIIPTRYYREENKDVLDRIEESYSKTLQQKAFTLGFSDKYFQTISLEIITDSLKYVYEFGLEENV